MSTPAPHLSPDPAARSRRRPRVVARTARGAQPRPQSAHPTARAFTLVEVLVATALLALVGTAILAFLSAFADGAARRARLCDPALEGVLAARRLSLVAPGLRCALAIEADLAAVWLSDRVASRSVHLSELGWVRFDHSFGEIVLEQVDPEALAADPTLETEFAARSDFLGVLEELRRDRLVVATLLAEGVEEAHLSRGPAPGALTLELAAGNATSRVALTKPIPEEPLR